MTIKIKPAASHAPLTELDGVTSVPIPIDMVRMMVPLLHIASVEGVGIVWQGIIWECIDDGANVLNYPGVRFDIHVGKNGCMVVMDSVYGPGLFSQWLLEQSSMPMITQTHMLNPGPMRSCS